MKRKAAPSAYVMQADMVVIVKLATESPKGISVFWDTRLEKMLVDIAVDKLLKECRKQEKTPQK